MRIAAGIGGCLLFGASGGWMGVYGMPWWAVSGVVLLVGFGNALMNVAWGRT